MEMNSSELFCSVYIYKLVRFGSHSSAAEDSGLLGCHTVLLGEWLPILWRNVVPWPWKVKALMFLWNVKNHSTNENTPHYRQPESTFPSLYVFISSDAISNVLPRVCCKIINRWL